MIFDWLNPKAWLAWIGAAALVGVSAYGLGRVHGADKIRAKWNDEKAVQAATALKATKDNAAKQIRWVDNVSDAATKRKTDEAATANMRSRLAATERRLRNYAAAGRSGVPEAAADACHQALAAKRRDLAACGAGFAALGAELAEREDDIRQLTEAWPQ